MCLHHQAGVLDPLLGAAHSLPALPARSLLTTLSDGNDLQFHKEQSSRSRKARTESSCSHNPGRGVDPAVFRDEVTSIQVGGPGGVSAFASQHAGALGLHLVAESLSS